MANLLGQNIGTNYKGILNLNTLNGNLSGTLQAVTDGDGNASPLTLSTDEVGISRTIALSSGATNVRLINETYTINNVGTPVTGTATGIFLNATETALNGMGHNLMDLQTTISGVTTSRFKIDNNGAVTTPGAVNAGSFSIGGFGSYSINIGGDGGRIYGATNGFTFTNLNVTGALFLQLGGTDATYPAIKKGTGATIDFVNAADTGFCGVSGLYIRFGSGSPEAVVTAPIGAIYSRTDGGANTTLYVKESGAGNTGWVAK